LQHHAGARAERPTSMSVLTRLLNVPALVHHLWAHRARKSVWDPAHDLELALYGAVFGNNFLHYGYFKQPPTDPESISLAQVKQAVACRCARAVTTIRSPVTTYVATTPWATAVALGIWAAATTA
jgi:hypothetical protein